MLRSVVPSVKEAVVHALNLVIGSDVRNVFLSVEVEGANFCASIRRKEIHYCRKLDSFRPRPDQVLKPSPDVMHYPQPVSKIPESSAE